MNTKINLSLDPKNIGDNPGGIVRPDGSPARPSPSEGKRSYTPSEIAAMRRLCASYRLEAVAWDFLAAGWSLAEAAALLEKFAAEENLPRSPEKKAVQSKAEPPREYVTHSYRGRAIRVPLKRL